MRVRVSLGAPSFVVRKVKGTWASYWLDNNQIPYLPQIILFQCSTAVVQLTVNQLVVGSIPATGASFVVSVSKRKSLRSSSWPAKDSVKQEGAQYPSKNRILWSSIPSDVPSPARAS